MIYRVLLKLKHIGHFYFVTNVYDKSRFTWIYLLRNKNDVLQVNPRFFKLIETQFSKVIKTFWSDNASEQNLIVERKHQSLLNVARALMFQSKVPIIFWGECILTATYLTNRTPMVLLQIIQHHLLPCLKRMQTTRTLKSSDVLLMHPHYLQIDSSSIQEHTLAYSCDIHQV